MPLTAVFVGERQQITKVCTYFHKIPQRLAVWEEKLSAVKISYSRLLLCCFNVYAIFKTGKYTLWYVNSEPI